MIARAGGLGNLGGDIVSNEKELFLIVNVGRLGLPPTTSVDMDSLTQPGALLEASAPPPPLHYKLEGIDQTLGVSQAFISHKSSTDPSTSHTAMDNRSAKSTCHGGPAVCAWCAWSRADADVTQIGGLLLFRINIMEPPTDVAIYSIRIKVMQHFKLTSPPGREPPYVETPPPDSRTVALLDLHHPPNMGRILATTSGTRSGTQTPRSGAMAVLSPGEPYKAHHLVRLLNDNIIRASTQPGTETSINLRHDIVIEIIYQELFDELDGTASKGKNRDSERKMFTISKPLEIYSVSGARRQRADAQGPQDVTT